MTSYLRTTVLVLAALALTACSPARTGVVDGALTTNLKPGLGITPNKPLTLASSGRVWAPLKGDDTAFSSSAAFDYAVYIDPSVPPVEKFAYAAFIRLEDKNNWMFLPQGHGLPGQFGAVKPVSPANREGRMYTLRVPAQNDWASDLLLENGQTPPEEWIAARWVFSLDSDARAMAEYREPWPEHLDVPSPGIMPLRDADAEWLRGFEKRALEAFSFEASRGDFRGVPKAGPAWKTPRVNPDAERLAGEVMRITNGDDASDFQ